MKHRINDQDTSRSYFTQIPKIILTLGLTPFELALYVHLKQTAGETGKCWKSTKTLSDESGMSTGMVSKAKASLAMMRPILGGKPLIVVDEEKGAGKPSHLVTLVDIWPENIAQRSPGEVQSSHSELQRSPGEVQSSHSETNKNPRRRKHEEQAAAPPDIPPPSLKDRLYLHFKRCYELPKNYGVPYVGKNGKLAGDFIQLARLMKAYPDAQLERLWPQAVKNYFATPQSSRTMADLCVRFADFQKHPLDKFKQPIVSEEDEKDRPKSADEERIAEDERRVNEYREARKSGKPTEHWRS